MISKGFQLYDVVHISWLTISFIVIVLMSSCYVRLSLAGKRRMRLIIGWTFIVAEIVKNWYIWRYEVWQLNALPLELCALAMFAILIHAYTKSTAVGETLYAVFLPGAICALLFPEWTHRSLINFISIHSFVYHILIVGYICMVVRAKEVVPTIRRLWQPALFLAIVVPIMYIVNQQLNTNFFFLSKPAKGSPIMLLEQIFGNPGYIFGLVLLLIIVWILLYSGLFLYQRVKKPHT